MSDLNKTTQNTSLIQLTRGVRETITAVIGVQTSLTAVKENQKEMKISIEALAQSQELLRENQEKILETLDTMSQVLIANQTQLLEHSEQETTKLENYFTNKLSSQLTKDYIEPIHLLANNLKTMDSNVHYMADETAKVNETMTNLDSSVMELAQNYAENTARIDSLDHRMQIGLVGGIDATPLDLEQLDKELAQTEEILSKDNPDSALHSLKSMDDLIHQLKTYTDPSENAKSVEEEPLKSYEVATESLNEPEAIHD